MTFSQNHDNLFSQNQIDKTYIRQPEEEVMKFDKLVIHEVDGFSHKIISSVDCPEFGFLVWNPKPNQSGIDIKVSIQGFGDACLRTICGCCRHYSTGQGQWWEDKEVFIKAVRVACVEAGIKQLCFTNALYNPDPGETLIELGNEKLQLLDPRKSDFDRLLLEEAFEEVVNLEFRLKFFQSYYVQSDAIRVAQKSLRGLRAMRDGLDSSWGKSSRVLPHQILCHVENVRTALTKTPLTMEDLETSEGELQAFLG